MKEPQYPQSTKEYLYIHRIGEMRGLRLLSQHVQVSSTLTYLAVNDDCHEGFDLLLYE